ncbi:(2Fe-2S)-binding protein [Streptomyces sp. N2-109]|uniref:(2Fe-2S)-binding protein n=1 Tax=Streptomyces gossypii TaxID=2883101 RepID=A0ABT2K2E8_9ACTN|nr:(2Fe-2S)-binding protein [Streptomyces gossypii]MCT2594161.1 (2Fe-2S)-binding protein [Streptomyces gossypii]
MTLPTLVPGAVPDTVGSSVLAPVRSPFSDAYTRLTEVFPSLRVLESATVETGDGWVTATELARGGPVLDAFLAWDDTQVAQNYGQRARPDVVASFALHRYAWPVCLLMTIPWFLYRRVPRLPVEAVSFQRVLGQLSVRTGEFSCLPGDPAAGEPGARVVADEEELRAALRSAVAEHLGPMLEAFRPRLRRGSRALWGMATDEITEGLWYVGHLLGEEQRAMAEAAQLLPGATAPYGQGAAFRELSGPSGEQLPTRDRASCCLFYTLRPEDTCVTCPRTCDSERIERLTGIR